MWENRSRYPLSSFLVSDLGWSGCGVRAPDDRPLFVSTRGGGWVGGWVPIPSPGSSPEKTGFSVVRPPRPVLLPHSTSSGEGRGGGCESTFGPRVSVPSPGLPVQGPTVPESGDPHRLGVRRDPEVVGTGLLCPFMSVLLSAPFR